MSKSTVTLNVKSNDSVWRRIKSAVTGRTLRGSYVKVGIVGEENKVVDAEGVPQKFTVARLAAVHEFGATIKGNRGVIKIPERSFLRSTFEEHEDEYMKDLTVLAQQVYEAKVKPRQALDLVGMKMVAHVKAKIRSNIPPPNAPSVYARKLLAGEWNKRGKAQARGGTPVTLIDTSKNLLNRITHLVVLAKGTKDD